MTFALGSLFLVLVAGQIGIFMVAMEIVKELKDIRSDHRLFARGLIDQSDLGN